MEEIVWNYPPAENYFLELPQITVIQTTSFMASAQYTVSMNDMLLSAEMPLMQSASLGGESRPGKATARVGMILET